MNECEFYLEDLRSKFEKINPDEYYLAYSGGRDSHFLLWFIREYLHETRIPAVFSNTGMEIPEIRERALANADIVLKPAMKHAEIKEKFGIPLNTKASDTYVYYYQKHIFEEGKTEEELSDTFRWIALQDISRAPKKHEGIRSRISVPQKTISAMRTGLLHKVSPYCCKYLKKMPGKLFEEREREREERRRRKYLVLWAQSHGPGAMNIPHASQKPAHFIRYGILLRIYSIRSKLNTTFPSRKFTSLSNKQAAPDVLTVSTEKINSETQI